MEKATFTKETFTSKFLRRLTALAGDGYTVNTQQIKKNNGLVKTGIILRGEEKNFAPVFYEDDLYDQYLRGVSLDKLVMDTWEFYQHEMRHHFRAETFTDWEQIKSRLFLRVAATDQNLELLKTSIHKEVLDLSLIVYARIGFPSANDMGTVTVSKEHLDIWGQTETDVYETARKNTLREKPRIEPIERVMLLSNEYDLYGAVYMMFPEILNNILLNMNTDLGIYILPSSVHEVVLMKAVPLYDSQFLQQLVMDTNANHLPPELRLSDHIYQYDLKGGLTIVQTKDK